VTIKAEYQKQTPITYEEGKKETKEKKKE